ncbi:UDP-phosphate N-acetylgalactosaminyl-1-phosphate transferase [Alteribacter lacisalsi]|uniref:UDP-phosphate N-acetylgalactosaminyl-1-phosphate transferase n=2 Tax=Alteribacter lacisalsi TaxID=2045244 RepID=A0A2W0H6G2_9BACI|nr:exopolysaccharide biosynthesis polyprenyl glycosylphosphotransferase [Alteribacter lacisalsi]PYZ96286.1 UDP-phosphate N-acetylgalactosaminyl-1-phosphate transferase [Alteribacter lacisalsi]
MFFPAGGKKGYHLAKRIMDILLALIGLVIAFPVLLAAAIVIKLDTPGPVFFSQVRVGWRGETFRIYKLRSMVQTAEKNGVRWTKVNDPRVTRAGAWIRKTRIDELPQLYNVLIGDMSMVGPRPERPFFTKQFSEEIPGFTDRLAVKPGLTGWAQVNGGYDVTPRQKLKYDREYINNQSLRLDAKTLLLTCKVVITGSGAR